MRIAPRDVTTVTAAVLAPFLAALALLPLRTSVTHTNLALLLVVVVVVVSAPGNRFARAPATPPGTYPRSAKVTSTQKRIATTDHRA
ncbi:hypothetical protein ACFU8W_34850 [Streptomyces sp. NPDC057565]|uniref:hypothetical protein n=1 Tax=Streptomyces sp. NPDC057565 TaxID=3346169 RepID=UPI0036B5941C